MNKVWMSSVVLAAFYLGGARLAVALCILSHAQAAIIHVPAGGSVQAAVDGGLPGDTVMLGPGDYFGTVWLKDNMVLAGAEVDATTVRALTRAGWYLVVGANGTHIRDLTIADAQGGLYIGQDDSVLISNCAFVGNNTGLVLAECRDFRVQGCVFTGNATAVNLDSSQGEIRHCDIHGNERAILCLGWARARISACRISCNLWGVDARNVDGDSQLVVSNCILRANGFAVRSYATRNPVLVNCTLWGNVFGLTCYGEWPSHIAVSNSLIWDTEEAVADVRFGSVEILYSNVEGGWPGEGNIDADPQFADPLTLNFGLRPQSPCIDAGDNGAPGLPETDVVGTHRIMYGGKSPTVDMGAYEYHINELTLGPGPVETTFAWSSLAERTYSIFYSDDLLTWTLAVEAFPSSGNQTTSWIDDGSLTGLPPSLVVRRFYRILENP